MRTLVFKLLTLYFLLLGIAAAQDLPSLAPVIEKVQPAVVNIATRGRVRMEENPLFSSPFFRSSSIFPICLKSR